MCLSCDKEPGAPQGKRKTSGFFLESHDSGNKHFLSSGKNFFIKSTAGSFSGVSPGRANSLITYSLNKALERAKVGRGFSGACQRPSAFHDQKTRTRSCVSRPSFT